MRLRLQDPDELILRHLARITKPDLGGLEQWLLYAGESERQPESRSPAEAETEQATHEATVDPEEVEDLCHQLELEHARTMLAELAYSVAHCVASGRMDGLKEYFLRWLATLEEVVAGPEIVEHVAGLPEKVGASRSMTVEEVIEVIVGREGIPSASRAR